MFDSVVPMIPHVNGSWEKTFEADHLFGDVYSGKVITYFQVVFIILKNVILLASLWLS